MDRLGWKRGRSKDLYKKVYPGGMAIIIEREGKPFHWFVYDSGDNFIAHDTSSSLEGSKIECDSFFNGAFEDASSDIFGECRKDYGKIR